jgi:hypothetical protein
LHVRENSHNALVIIVLSVAAVGAVAVKLRVSRRGGADISQAQFQERMEQKAGLQSSDSRHGWVARHQAVCGYPKH